MKIWSRINIYPDELEFTKPLKKAKKIISKYPQYLIDYDMGLLLVPIESDAYQEIQQLFAEFEEYYQEGIFELFENEFTKQEIDEAEYFEMRVEAIFNGYDEEITKYFTYCCEEETCFGEQIADYEIPPKEWRNRDLVFSDFYTFFVSQRIKEAIEDINASNVWFRPAWTKKDKEKPIAYQINVNEYMPPLKDINGWEIYEICPKCGKKLYESNIKGPIYITDKIKNSLKDFNATQEVFTKVSNSIIIVSRRIYELFKEMKVKKKRFEPIFIKDNI